MRKHKEVTIRAINAIDRLTGEAARREQAAADRAADRAERKRRQGNLGNATIAFYTTYQSEREIEMERIGGLEKVSKNEITAARVGLIAVATAMRSDDVADIGYGNTDYFSLPERHRDIRNRFDSLSYYNAELDTVTRPLAAEIMQAWTVFRYNEAMGSTLGQRADIHETFLQPDIELLRESMRTDMTNGDLGLPMEGTLPNLSSVDWILAGIAQGEAVQYGVPAYDLLRDNFMERVATTW